MFFSGQPLAVFGPDCRKRAKVTDKYLKDQEITLAQAKELSQEVRKLYDAMDNSLKFPEVGSGSKTSAPQAQQKAFRDFRGVACPMNFVKTKLVMETMQVGEILEIFCDDLFD